MPGMTGFLLLLIGAAFTLSMVLTAMMGRLSPRLGLVAQPGGRRIHERPTPKGGGVAIFLSFWSLVWLGVAVCWMLQRSGTQFDLWPGLAAHAQGVMGLASHLGVIFLGSAIIWMLGMADDLWSLSPWVRLAVEAGVALMLVHFGKLNVTLFFEHGAIQTAVTVLWIVGLINAFNMLDNMDGLSAGVGGIIALFFAIVALETGHYFVAAFLACLIGALGGFLLFNFPPASIFMGDSGSTTLGYLLSVITVEYTFFQPERPYFPVVLPLLMFGLPLFDTITVVWIRVRSGRSPFSGDTNHFSHRLVGLGMSRRQAVLTIYLVTATVALGATVLYYANNFAIWVIFAQTVAIFTIIGILERARPSTPRPPQ